MNILVTGSSGFIASNLIPKLKKAGHHLIGVDSLDSKSTNHDLTSDYCSHHFFNINELEKLSQLLVDVDVVFHLAAKGNVVESIDDPLSNFQANVSSTLSLLEAMRVANCKRIIFSSTGGALMGDTSPPVDEQTLPQPISPYGASKLACEGYLSAYSKSFGISSIVLRFGNVYGPYSSHKVGVINRWIRLAIEGKPLVIYGDGKSSRDYIHVDDLTDGLQLALGRIHGNSDSVFETYHLANYAEITLLDLKEILECCLPGEKLDVIYKKARVGEVNKNFANISLAKSKLGFNPIVNFANGVSELYEWIQANEYSS